MGFLNKFFIYFRNHKGLIIGSLALVLLFVLAPVSNLNAIENQEVRQSLEDQINQIQEQINQYQQKIKETQRAASSLNNEIQILENQIKKIQLEIRQIDLAISENNLNIEDIDEKISQLEKDMADKRVLLAEYIRLMAQYDQESLLEIILENEKFSDFFDQLNTLETIQEKIQQVLEQIRGLKGDLAAQKSDLEQEREEQYSLRNLQMIQGRTVEKQQNRQESLLAQAKGEEKRYQELVAKGQQDIDFIRKQIYMLEGVGLSMTLQEALKHALLASSRTGVRPAFLLAVLKKESSWGTNVGTGTWRTDMAPRDQNAFLQICQELGRDPDTTPVSKKPWYGWGGAMGPAQFLPTTWLAYEARVAELTGHNPPDPWNIDDAFTAAGVKLAAAGADQRTEDAEWKAAMIYFAGSRWNRTYYRFYGDQVMELAAVIQDELNKIQ